MTIIDTCSRTDDRLPSLRQAGVTGVIRYYCRNTRLPGKRLTRVEAEKIVGVGLALAVVYQGKGNDAASFSLQGGELDGDYAHKYATGVIGQPEGSAIYFGVDYDAGAADVQERIIPYFRGVQSAFRSRGGKFKIGVYGSGAVCQAILDNDLASFAWVSLSSQHRGTAAFLAGGKWTLRQRAERTMSGIGVDTNDLNPSADGFGEFARLASPTGDGLVAEGGSLGDKSRQVEALQQALRQAGYQVGTPNGVFGVLTRAALLAFQADQGLAATGVADAATWAALDKNFRRPLAPDRVGADAEQLRADGSRVILGADNAKLAGLLSSALGVLGLSNSAAVEIADKIAAGAGRAGAAKAAADPGKLVDAFQKAAALPKAVANSAELKSLIDAIKEVQGAALDKVLSPENLQVLNIFKKALSSSDLTKQPAVAQFFEQLPVAVPGVPAAASKAAHTIFDLLPGLFSDGALQTLFQGAAVVADSVIPGFGGSLITLGLGLAVRLFADRIVDARVEDHRTGANLNR